MSVETTTCTSASLSSAFNAGKVPVGVDFSALSSGACPFPAEWSSSSTQLTQRGLGANQNKTSPMH